MFHESSEKVWESSSMNMFKGWRAGSMGTCEGDTTLIDSPLSMYRTDGEELGRWRFT